MNSPLQLRKARLRGFGGPAACGVPGTRARSQGITGLDPQSASARGDCSVSERLTVDIARLNEITDAEVALEDA
jgi:hypothetical protein